ncbi:oligosaccharide flippase family protein [Litoribrevibacter albus]|uniref:Lipopolysaccharide biosynthesis protein n=1 Tax=Litoribrevibacter albus TaxID=1473156 RepID=A0AA37W6S9_9GAMM|nr:oligosaccharide flippase family protein [Litoribrevibacter albus]GLQ30284.1 lipopolysaccharide biosynthesis protein [Litoribrevibacter albus]
MSASHELNSAIIRSITGKYALYVIQLLSLIILSRVFTPEEFGVLAAFQVIALFFQVVATSGIAPAVVFHENLTKEKRDGIFSASILIGISLVIVFLVSYEALFIWLGITESLILAVFLLINIFFACISMLPMAALQKDAMFIKISTAEVVAELVLLLLCFFLYFYCKFGFEALAVKILLTPLFRFICYYYFSKDTQLGRPGIGVKITAFSELFQFAKFQVLFNFLNFFSRNLDTLLVTKYFGTAVVGFYDKSYQLMRYPLQLFTFAITPALQPVLTKYKNEPGVVQEEFYHIAFKLAIVGIFASNVLYWGASDILLIMFGDQWFGATDILRVLAVSIPLQMVLSSTGGIYQAFGDTKSLFFCGVFSSFINVSAIIFGVMLDDVLWLCYLLISAFILNFIQCFWQMRKSVFTDFQLVKFLFLLVLCLIPYTNLLFFTISSVFSESVIESLFDVSLISLVSLVFSMIFFFLSKRLFG